MQRSRSVFEYSSPSLGSSCQLLCLPIIIGVRCVRPWLMNEELPTNARGRVKRVAGAELHHFCTLVTEPRAAHGSFARATVLKRTPSNLGL